jgi:hypothetical protein
VRYLNFFFAGVIGPGVNFAWAAVGRSFASWEADLVPFGPVRFGTLSFPLFLFSSFPLFPLFLFFLFFS